MSRQRKRKQAEAKVLHENINAESEFLSNRECEILDQLSCGASNKSLADSLGVTIHTVEKHLTSSHLKNDKLGLKPEIGASQWISKTNNGK